MLRFISNSVDEEVCFTATGVSRYMQACTGPSAPRPRNLPHTRSSYFMMSMDTCRGALLQMMWTIDLDLPASTKSVSHALHGCRCTIRSGLCVFKRCHLACAAGSPARPQVYRGCLQRGC